MSESAGCCRCCCSFILTSGLTALFLWLSLRTSKPVCSIQDFYVPALNQSENHSSNSSNSNSSNNSIYGIYFDLKLDNENNDKRIYYDTINLTFYYKPNTILIPIGNYTVPSFRQGHKKNTRRKNWIPDTGNFDELFRSSNLSIFRVELATKVRFKIIAWKTKRYKLEVGGDVEVNEMGKKMKRKGIRLKSGGFVCYPAHLLHFTAMVVLFVLL